MASSTPVDRLTQLPKNFTSYLHQLSIKRTPLQIRNALEVLDFEDPDHHYDSENGNSIEATVIPWRYEKDQRQRQGNVPTGNGSNNNSTTTTAGKFGLEGFKHGCLHVWEDFDFHKKQEIVDEAQIRRKFPSAKGEEEKEEGEEDDVEQENGEDQDYEYQLGERYEDKLDLQTDIAPFQIPLPHSQPIRPFKNNLYATHPNSKKSIYSYLATNTDIFIIHNEQLVSSQSIRPHITSYQDSVRSSFSDTPHAVNFVNSGVFLEKDVLVCCCDDGRCLVYDITQPLQLKLMAELVTEQSSWGCDFQGNVICVSDNSHKVTVFWMDEVRDSGYVSLAQSTRLEHNVPDLKIIKIDEEEGLVLVGCVSIAGEVLHVEFARDCSACDGVEFKPHLGEDGVVRVNSSAEGIPTNTKYRFSSKMLSRVKMLESGWSLNLIEDCDFLEVFNSEYLGTTNSTIPDEQTIYERSHILDNKVNNIAHEPLHLYTSDLGTATYFETVIPITKFNQPENDDTDDIHPHDLPVNDQLVPLSHQFNRIAKVYCETPHLAVKNGQNHYYHLVTTDNRVALFTDSLTLSCFTPALFEATPGQFIISEVLLWHNRLSIVKVVRQLSLVLVVSQMGVLSGFRLVNYRGIKSLREEFTIPERLNDEADYERIVGLDWKQTNDVQVRVMVSVVFGEGTVKRFEVRESSAPNESLVVSWL